MKSLINYLNEYKKLNESSITDNCLVTFAKCGQDAGIMFGTQDDEIEPESVKEICDELGLDYYDDDYNNIDTPVYFWNVTRNTSGWVSRERCKDLI